MVVSTIEVEVMKICSELSVAAVLRLSVQLPGLTRACPVHFVSPRRVCDKLYLANVFKLYTCNYKKV